jgi:hypothetical protein
MDQQKEIPKNRRDLACQKSTVPPRFQGMFRVSPVASMMERLEVWNFRGTDHGQKGLGCCQGRSRLGRARGCGYWVYQWECCLLFVFPFTNEYIISPK